MQMPWATLIGSFFVVKPMNSTKINKSSFDRCFISKLIAKVQIVRFSSLKASNESGKSDEIDQLKPPFYTVIVLVDQWNNRRHLLDWLFFHLRTITLSHASKKYIWITWTNKKTTGKSTATMTMAQKNSCYNYISMTSISFLYGNISSSSLCTNTHAACTLCLS